MISAILDSNPVECPKKENAIKANDVDAAMGIIKLDANDN
jgi:hypothetical protein